MIDTGKLDFDKLPIFKNKFIIHSYIFYFRDGEGIQNFCL
jgi:hypothetical protein